MHNKLCRDFWVALESTIKEHNASSEPSFLDIVCNQKSSCSWMPKFILVGVWNRLVVIVGLMPKLWETYATLSSKFKGDTLNSRDIVYLITRIVMIGTCGRASSSYDSICNVWELLYIYNFCMICHHRFCFSFLVHNSSFHGHGKNRSLTRQSVNNAPLFYLISCYNSIFITTG